MRNPKILEGFYALEGIDGAGTTTQLNLLEERHKETEVPVWCTCEPTTEPIGRLIRRVLSGDYPVRPETLAHLFVSDRYEHLHGVTTGILSRLDLGQRVITDRYLFSSLAYQSVECGFDFVLSLNEAFPLPERLFYIDVPVEVGAARSAERSAGKEALEIFERLEFQKVVIANYQRVLDLYDASGMKIHVLDGTDSVSVISEKIWSLLST